MKNTRTEHINFAGKPFYYKGYLFTPVKSLKRGWFDKGYNHIGGIVDGIPFNYDEFYKVATKNGCRYVDIFEVNDKKVIPCNSLMQWN